MCLGYVCSYVYLHVSSICGQIVTHGKNARHVNYLCTDMQKRWKLFDKCQIANDDSISMSIKLLHVDKKNKCLSR